MGRERVVTAPDGERWRVRRRWMDRPPPKIRRLLNSENGLEGAIEAIPFVDFDESIVVSLVAIGVVLLIVIVLLPLLGVALEVIVVILLIASGGLSRVVLRRPWVIEAVNLDDPERSAAFAVRGWRRSEDAIETLKREIAATGSPTPPPGDESA